MLHRRTFLQLSACAGAQLAFQRVVRAQSYPDRPITLVVPFPAGGPTDVIARIFAERLRQALGQAVIVENVAGAGATIGVARVIRAAPDGYTLSAGNSTSHVGGPAIYPFTYDILNDLEPVALLSMSPTLLVARKDFPANTVRDLDRLAERQPWQGDGRHIRCGQLGPTRQHLVSEPDRQSLPDRSLSRRSPRDAGFARRATDLRFAAEGSQSLPYLRDGQIKALAVLAPARWAPTPTYRPLTRLACRGFTCRCGTAYGRPREPRRTSS